MLFSLLPRGCLNTLLRLIRILVAFSFAMTMVSCEQLERIFSTSANTDLTAYKAVLFDPDSVSIRSEHLLYVAKDKKEGLISFDSLDADKGMIFLYEGKVSHAFTMKGMQFNIDIIFLARKNGNNGERFFRVVHIEPDAKVDETDFASPHQYEAVLEVPANQAAAAGIQIGDEMLLSWGSLVNADFLGHDTNSSYSLDNLRE